MAHQLKITLAYTEPKIYRTVIVPEKFTFHDLHLVIQTVMNWANSHLYQFNTGAPYRSDSIQLPEEEEDMFLDFPTSRYKKLDSTQTYLATYFNHDTKKMNYTYDFGDDWLHQISVLKKPSEEVLFPKCIKGEHAAPIEDCGGIPGFYNILEILSKKKKTPEDNEMLEWVGIPKRKSYEDVFGFYIDEINEELEIIFS